MSDWERKKRDPETGEPDEDLVWRDNDPSNDEELSWEEENDQRKLYNALRVKDGEEPEDEGEEEIPEVPGSRTGRLKFLREQTEKAEEVRNSIGHRTKERERKRDRIRAIFVLAALIGVLIPAILLYANNYRLTTYSVDGELSLGASGATQLYSFGNGNVIIGSDTVIFTEDLNVTWNALIHLEHPIFVSEGDYFAIADRGGYQFHICDRTGILSTVRVSRKIRALDISAAGVVAVSTESSDSSFVSYFDRFGTKISVEVKTVLDVSGYPVSLSVSPDGQKLLVVYYCVQNGIGESRVSLYDFKNGKADKSYVIASYEDFYNTDTYLVDCRFFDDRHAVVIGNNELVFLTNFQKGSADRTTVKVTDRIRSALFSDDYLLLIQDQEDSSEGAVARIYDENGAVGSAFSCPGDYDFIVPGNEYVLFGNKEDVTLYNVSGVERYQGTLTFAPRAAAFTKGRSILFYTGSKFQKITLK